VGGRPRVPPAAARRAALPPAALPPRGCRKHAAAANLRRCRPPLPAARRMREAGLLADPPAYYQPQRLLVVDIKDRPQTPEGYHQFTRNQEGRRNREAMMAALHLRGMQGQIQQVSAASPACAGSAAQARLPAAGKRGGKPLLSCHAAGVPGDCAGAADQPDAGPAAPRVPLPQGLVRQRLLQVRQTGWRDCVRTWAPQVLAARHPGRPR
jgi:hypothetical protein